MKVYIIILLFCFSTFLTTSYATQNVNLPQPLFLKLGFSSVIEFSDVPERIVVGDSQSFQVEKLNKSLVVRTLVPYASSNLFVYFKNESPQIFTLTASEDAIPSTYKKVEFFKVKESINLTEKSVSAHATKTESKTKSLKEGIRLTKSSFDKSKDYLTIDFKITASDSVIKPKWDLIRLSCKDKKIVAYKIWSARREIQKDSEVRARLIYLRPEIGITLKSCYIIVPLSGRSDSMKLVLGGDK